MCKKEYEQVLESKDETWRKKNDYKNLEDFSYKVDKAEKAKKAEKEEKEEKNEKNEDETDQELPQLIKSKYEFNELKNYILSIVERNKVMT